MPHDFLEELNNEKNKFIFDFLKHLQIELNN